MKQGGRGIRILWMERFMTLVVVYNLSIWLLHIKKKKEKKESWIADLTKTNDKTKSTQFALIAVEPEHTAHTGCLLDLFINRSCDQKGRPWWLLQEGHRWQADTTVMTHELTIQIYNDEKEEEERDRNLMMKYQIQPNSTQKEELGGRKEKTRDKAMRNNSKMKTAFGACNFQIHNVLCRKLHY